MQNKIMEAVEADLKEKIKADRKAKFEADAKADATYEEKPDLPAFRPGDTVKVNFRIIEGTKERIQAYEGLVIAIHRAGLSSTFKVRKVVGDVGVERTFPFYSPRIDSMEVKRAGRVRRAKLYYMRELRGKATRIKERKKGF